MTPARKAALQWFHDRGEVPYVWALDDRPSDRLIRLMLEDEQLEWSPRMVHYLTDKGRRALHGDDK
jgi:hypothetical protein